MKKVVIKETKIWSVESVRETCIRNRLYTCGDNEDYEKMMDRVTETEFNPTLEDIYEAARDIALHSDDDQTVENVMFLLANEAVKSVFDIE